MKIIAQKTSKEDSAAIIEAVKQAQKKSIQIDQTSSNFEASTKLLKKAQLVRERPCNPQAKCSRQMPGVSPRRSRLVRVMNRIQ